MPKTRDAFAFKTLSYILKNTIGEFSIPKFDYAPCSDDDDGEEFQAFCAISDWLNVSDSDMPPYRGTLRVEYILDESTKKLQKLQSSLDFIDVHIVRLRRYLLSVSKKITSSADLSSRAALELKRERASFLLWQYEWLEEVLSAYKFHIEQHIESQKENLKEQYKKEFAERLRLARLRKKINQAEVAAKLELTPAAYSNYERGVRDLPMFTIYRLTQILNVTADELFGIKK